MSWLKENWFKIGVLSLLVLIVIIYRYEFLYTQGNLIIRCNKIIGDCMSMRVRLN